MSEVKEYKTRDLSFSAYLNMRIKTDDSVKMEFIRFDRGSERKVFFVYSDPINQVDNLMVEFLNSESKMFDSEVRDMKKLLF